MKNPEFKVKVKDKKWDLVFYQDKPTIIDAHIQNGLVLTRNFEGVLRLNSGHQIIAQGLGIYRAGENKFKPGELFTIPITGGTGKYIGLRGELVTLLRADGTYRHKFRFKN